MNRLFLFASIACIVVVENELGAEAFVPRTSISSALFSAGVLRTQSITRLAEQPPDKPNGEESKKNLSDGALDFLFNPYESKIPKEIEKEIYEIEGNTPAAKERTKRVIQYGLIAFFGVLLAFFNAFITELRSGPTPDGNPVDLATTSFGWVMSNPVTSFLFLNKIGGGVCLLGGAGAGLLAEAEFDGRRTNAEKIYVELDRRRNNGTEKKVKRNNSAATANKKKRRSGKETKRMEALYELKTPEAEEIIAADDAPEKEPVEEPVAKEEKKDGGLFGKLKGFYSEADNMAASQAILFNKELEDRGVVEKITDETGMRVVGKEAASKLKESKEQKSDASTTDDDAKQ
jgi:hypothetical protein